MRTRSIALALVLFVVVAAAGAATAAERFETKVTIKGKNGDYYGFVKSPNAAECADGRKVFVHMMEGSRPKPKSDEKIGSDTAGPSGNKVEWSIGNSGFTEGEFYARVKKTDACKGDISKVISRP